MAPGRWWYLLAAAVLLAGMAGAAAFLFPQLERLERALVRVIVPGAAELKLEQPGRYTVFHEFEGVVDGRYYAAPEVVPGLGVGVIAAESGEPVPVEPPGGRMSYSIGGRSGVSMVSFEIQEPGAYRFFAAYGDRRTEPQVVLAVGQGFGGKLAFVIGVTIAIGFGSFALAAAIFGVIHVKRRKASRAANLPRAAGARI